MRATVLTTGGQAKFVRITMSKRRLLFRGGYLAARFSAGAFAVAAGMAFSPLALATEGGIGRPITGMQIAPYAGIVPPTDDWIISVTSIYYEGSLGASK